jgi:hypothetical protein
MAFNNIDTGSCYHRMRNGKKRFLPEAKTIFPDKYITARQKQILFFPKLPEETQGKL